MTIRTDADAGTTPRVTTPLAMAFVRTPLILLGMSVAFVVFVARGYPDALPLAATTSTIAVTVTNVVNLGLLRRLLHREGRRVRALIGFNRTRLARDVGWGFVWLFAFYALFVIPLVLVPLAIFQPTTAAEFQAAYAQTFTGLYADLQTTNAIPAWLGIIVGVSFPFLNAPVEELHYRGWVQPRLAAATGRLSVGIAIAALGFGLQHILFAASLAGAVTYFFAFVLWGGAAGLVYQRQKRLLPLIVAHFLTNLPFGVLPVVFSLTG